MRKKINWKDCCPVAAVHGANWHLATLHQSWAHRKLGATPSFCTRNDALPCSSWTYLLHQITSCVPTANGATWKVPSWCTQKLLRRTPCPATQWSFLGRPFKWSHHLHYWSSPCTTQTAVCHSLQLQIWLWHKALQLQKARTGLLSCMWRLPWAAMFQCYCHVHRGVWKGRLEALVPCDSSTSVYVYKCISLT